mgnify:CR=1 FL=1
MDRTVADTSETQLHAAENTIQLRRAASVYDLVVTDIPTAQTELNDTVQTNIDGAFTYTTAAIDAAIDAIDDTTISDLTTLGTNHALWQVRINYMYINM